MYQSGILALRLCLLLACSFLCFTGLHAQNVNLKVAANISESHCAGNGHVISVKAEGGEAPYSFLWNDGVKGHFRKDLREGTYICTVRDSKGEVQSKKFTFEAQPAPLALGYKIQDSGNGAYRVNLEPKGGKAPYGFFWFGPGIDINTTKNKVVLEGLKKGVYQVVVQDAYGCSTNVTINLN